MVVPGMNTCAEPGEKPILRLISESVEEVNDSQTIEFSSLLLFLQGWQVNKLCSHCQHYKYQRNK